MEAQLLVGLASEKRLWLQGLTLAKEMLTPFPCWHLFRFIMGRNEHKGSQAVVTRAPVGRHTTKFAGAC